MSGHTKWEDVRATGAVPDDAHIQRLRAEIERLQEENDALRLQLVNLGPVFSNGTWKPFDPTDFIGSKGVGAKGMCGSSHCANAATWTFEQEVTRAGKSMKRFLPRCEAHGPDVLHTQHGARRRR